MENEALKPCPFCGNTLIKLGNFDLEQPDWTAWCGGVDGCGVETRHCTSMSDAVRMWNARATDSRVAELEAALQRIHDECLKNSVNGIGNIALDALAAKADATPPGE